MRFLGTVVLLHGWLGRPAQVEALRRTLSTAGFTVLTPAYRSLLGDLEAAVSSVEGVCRSVEGDLHLVGFSLGGLVARAAAARGIPNLRSMLLIGVANAGSPLADLVGAVLPTSCLSRLSTRAPRLPDPPSHVRVGCIAGRRRGWVGLLMRAANDTRVPVASTLAVRHDAARVLDLKHRVLPSAPEPLTLAVNFLRTGGFDDRQV